MASALITHLSTLSATGRVFTRFNLIELLRGWIKDCREAPCSNDSAWERVNFEFQWGIEHAVAGMRLGPPDTNACPGFTVCDEIVLELQRSHFYLVVGTPGCGKSITGWHTAKRFTRDGFTVWRPRPSAKPEDLIAKVPTSSQSFLVVDDSHILGRVFAERISELARIFHRF